MSKISEERIDPRSMPPGTKVWIYLRTFPKSAILLVSPEAAIQNLVREKEWVIDRVFRDSVASGGSTRRVDFWQMMRLATQESRAADLIIIWSCRHFAKNMAGWTIYVADLLRYGWQILVMNDKFPYGILSYASKAMLDRLVEQSDWAADYRRGEE